MIAPDATTFDYLAGRPHAPVGPQWDAAMQYWKELHTDGDATFDAEVEIDADALTPFVTWGTNPGQGLPLSERVPDPARSPMRASGSRCARHCPTWTYNPVHRCVTSRWTRCSSGPAPTGGSRTCGPRRRCSPGTGCATGADAGGSRLDAGARSGRGRGPA